MSFRMLISLTIDYQVVYILTSVYLKIVKALLGSGNNRKISGLKFIKNTLDLLYFAFVRREIFGFGRPRNFLPNFYEVLGWAFQQTCGYGIDFNQYQRCCVFENGR